MDEQMIGEIIQSTRRSVLISEPALREAEQIGESNLRVNLAWCFHKAGSRSIHLNKRKKLVKQHEPGGAWFYSILILCQEIHRIERLDGFSSYSNRYVTPLVWFQAIVIELANADLRLLFDAWEKKEQGSKDSSLAVPRKMNQDLMGGEPKNPVIEAEQPHMWRLLQASIEYSSLPQSKQWDQQYFRGKKQSKNDKSFVASHRRFLASLKKYGAVPNFDRTDRLYFNTQGGKRHKGKKKSRKLTIAELIAQ